MLALMLRSLVANNADAIPDGVEYVLIMVIPLGIVQPVVGIIQLACIFFIWIRAIRRYRRKPHRDILDRFALTAWIIGGYIGAVTLTNLLLIAWHELA